MGVTLIGTCPSGSLAAAHGHVPADELIAVPFAEPIRWAIAQGDVSRIHGGSADYWVGQTRDQSSLNAVLSRKADAVVIRPSCIGRNQA